MTFDTITEVVIFRDSPESPYVFNVGLRGKCGLPHFLHLPAAALLSYEAFRLAVLEKAGMYYRDRQFEGKDGDDQWREEWEIIFDDADPQDAEFVGEMEDAA